MRRKPVQHIPLVDMDIGILQKAVNAIKARDGGKAAALFDEYIVFVDQHYDEERTPY